MSNNENKIVKDSLTEALLLLMEAKEYTQISITDIAKKAGVSRMAYYRNFDTKKDILEYYFDRSCHELYQRHNPATDKPFLKNLLQYIYTFFVEKQAVVTALKKANLTNLLLAYFDQIVYEGTRISLEVSTTHPTPHKYHLYFFSGAFYNFFMKWFDNGMQESYEEIVEIVTSLIPEDVKKSS